MLSALLEDQGDPERWKSLILPSIQELRHRHPDLSIQLNYTTYPYNEMREKLLSAAENQTEIDLITLDQIWLGEFAEKGFLTNLTNYTKAGKGKTIGMKRAGMEAFTRTRHMQSGHGPISGVYGTGKICWIKLE